MLGPDLFAVLEGEARRREVTDDVSTDGVDMGVICYSHRCDTLVAGHSWRDPSTQRPAACGPACQDLYAILYLTTYKLVALLMVTHAYDGDRTRCDGQQATK